MSARTFRLTLRFGTPRRYHIADLAATSLADALAMFLAQYPGEAGDADLLEIRLQADPEQRSYVE
jgi:hypothetical protein